MSQVFYQKWRPQTFDQVVGQEKITRTLRNAVDSDRISHAYLFCGPRGTGKTSTARILAKAVNCLSPNDGEPDNQCDVCVAINEGRDLDLIEIDAASNRKIDDIRDIKEKANFLPNSAKYKVYVLDEAHMLTEPASNALLKTLEEPPSHVIFVLATTDPSALPLTIVSRCQRFDFRKIPLDVLEKRLSVLCKSENVEVDAESLTLIGRVSYGSLRDAENLLEQALVSYGSPLDKGQVSDLLNIGVDDRSIDLVTCIVNKSIPQGLAVINEVRDSGDDLRQFHRGVLDLLRGILLLKSGSSFDFGYSDETKTNMMSLAKKTSSQHILTSLSSFLKADLRRDISSQLPLEVALIETGIESKGTESPDTVSDISAESEVVHEINNTEILSEENQPEGSSDLQDNIKIESNSLQEDHNPDESKTVEVAWKDIVNLLSRHKGKRFNLGALLRDCKEQFIDGEVLRLRFLHRSHMERMAEEMEDPRTRKIVEDVLVEVLEHSYKVEISMIDDSHTGKHKKSISDSHLVRMAQSLGAAIVSEKEEDDHEQKDD